MKKPIKTAGKILLAAGALTLVAGVLCAFSVGTVATPILILASILLNSLGVTLLRSGKEG